jgi:hypothetical protein
MFLANQQKMLLNLQNSFGGDKVQFPLFLLVDTLLVSSRQSTVIFQRSFVFENPENMPTNRKTGIKQILKTIIHALPVFKRVLQIQKNLVLSSSEDMNSIQY